MTTHMPTPHRLAVLRQYPTDITDGELIAMIDWIAARLAPRARRSDPETSHAAAAAASPMQMNEKRQAVLECIRRCGPGTDPQIWDAYQSMTLPQQTPQSVRSRRAELVSMGHVIARSVERIDGRLHTVWGIA